MIRVGIIGRGFAWRVVVPAFEFNKNFSVAAVCSSHVEEAKTFAEKHNIPKVYRYWEDLLIDCEIDAVAIVVPALYQPKIALQAIRQKKHVFLEKPLALDEKVGGQMLRAAERARVAHVVDFEFPELAVMNQAKKILKSGKLGKLRQVQVNWHIETYAHIHKTHSWRNRSQEGGGMLNAFDSHILNYLEWFLGPLDRMMARIHSTGSGKKRDDAIVSLWATTASQVPITVASSANNFLGMGHRIEFSGEKGTLVLENRHHDHVTGFKLSLGTRERPVLKVIAVEQVESKFSDGRTKYVARLVDKFAHWIKTGKKQSPHIAAGVRVDYLMRKAREADRTGRWQKL